MTVTITSALRIGLVAGTNVVLSGPVVPSVTTDDIFNPVNPTQTLTTMLDGFSSAKMVGSALLDTTSTGNHPLFTVPAGKVFIPTAAVFALTDVSGSGLPPSINLGTSGSFRELIDSVRSTTYDLTGLVPFAAGSGYTPADVLTLSGGTHTTTATANVTNTNLVSIAVNAPGTVYAPNNTITLAGGTASTKAVLTVATVKLVSATVNAGGTGYGATQTFTATVVGGTHSVTATVSVTSDGGGIVTTVNSVTAAGSYTVLPTLTGAATTGGTGTGLTLNLVFGINTITISTAGVYTVNSATFTQFATSGSGVGATFNTALFGVNAVAISVAGSYTVLPANHVATTGGSGTGATLDATWSVLASLFSNTTLAGQLVVITDFSTTVQTSLAYIPAGTAITARVDAATTYLGYTLECFLFGFVTSL